MRTATANSSPARARAGATVLLALAWSLGHAQELPAPNPQTRKLLRVCEACHTLGEDGGDGVGPNLWHIYGAKAGTRADFSYSDALRMSGVTWTDETLGKWLENPAKFLPGTKMAFPGLPDAVDRAALIAYLKRAYAADAESARTDPQ